MPDDKKAKETFWNPRVDPDSIKPSDKHTFSRPREFDFSDVAWNKRKAFWSQKEPMVEIEYRKNKN